MVSARRWGALAALGLLSALPQIVRAADPCKLLTVQDISQVLGASVSAPTPQGTTGCVWAGSSQRVSIELRDATAWARITASGSNASGLGDAMQFSDVDKENVTLSVKKGASVIVLTIYSIKGERRHGAAAALAGLAILRL